ncbi:MAG: CHASE4 domain-containing protein [Steroidobacterales bacterium]
MSIRPKVMILLTLVFMLLSGVTVLIQKWVVMPSFEQLEQKNSQISMHRVRHAMERNLEALQVSAMDWANWADIYRYVQDHNPEFVTTNITKPAIAQLQINAIMIVDRDGRVVVCSTKIMPSDLSLEGVLTTQGELRRDFRWREYLGTKHMGRGLVQTNLGVMMIAGAPILDGTGGGEPLGMVIMGRLLTPELLRRIESQTETAITMSADRAPGDLDRIVTTSAQTQVFGSFTDVYGKPAMTLRADTPRDITANGQRAILVAAASLAGAAMVILVLLLMLLNRYVLAPLTRLTRHVVAVGENPDLTERLNFTTEDEFGKLAREFDGMVERLATTRRDLVDQSFQAGFAEMAKGVLHNLGNALTPMGVRLAAMERRMRESPAADLELAVGELTGNAGDAARRAELLEFMALGCREMKQAVKETTTDIEVMQRQASLMRASLSDQMRGSNHKAPLLESVQLPELITQSLDIVPDASRRRLQLELDESLHKIGAVRVARTVLRLVLQNLIINAADAVRDSGKDRGVLRVAAEVVRENNCDILHLQCQDDGMGIDKDKLERVFEKGFSTKSKDTNQGIGLHWCANAILALGGHMWATSEGPGLGASLHMQFPLADSPR